MQPTTLLLLFALPLISAIPLTTRNQGDQPTFVNVHVTDSIELTANLNQLTSCKDGDNLCSSGELDLSPGAASAITSGTVECRGYSDEAGTEPLVVFGLKSPGKLGETPTGLVTVGSVLCYLT